MQERRLLGVVAEQLEPEAVDEEDDVRRSRWQHQVGAGKAGVDAERPTHRGQHVRERSVPVGRQPEAVVGRGHRTGAPLPVRADSVSAKSSRLATASGPSAAELTRSEKSSDVIIPV